ncbi:DUF2052 domain-containing protein [Aphelenchoides bicaudatus]|nr:DUF2052 domain-containing protein [Aphelenchoides bicaudatus]
MKEKLFEHILSKSDVFYRSQQRDEPELKDEEKRQILNELFEEKPSIFLERYHTYISKEHIDCFPKNDRCKPYLDLIKERKEQDNNRLVRNRRFMAMQKLKENGEYFSMEKMRERAPHIFDVMIADQIPDLEKVQMRPTVERRPGSGFSNLMEQFDESQRIAERRKRHFAEWEGCASDYRIDKFMNHVSSKFDIENEDFEMEFDSDDEEGREAEIKRKRHQNFARYNVDKELPERVYPDPTPSKSENPVRNIADETTRQLSALRVVEEETHPDDPKTTEEQMDSTGVEQNELVDEFRSFMEQRFMNGEDDQFVDYKQIDDDDSSVQLSKWREQELEDAYFADNET